MKWKAGIILDTLGEDDRYELMLLDGIFNLHRISTYG